MYKRFPGTLALTMFAIISLVSASGCANSSKKTQATAVVPVISQEASTIESKVVPIRNADLAFSGSGKIQEILAPEGVKVKKGDVIARLEGIEKANAAIAGGELQVISAQQNLDTLNEKYKVATAAAEMVVAQAQIDLKDAQDKRKDMNYQRVNDYTLEGIQAQLILAKNAVEQAEDVFKLVEDKAEDDPDRARAMLLLSQARANRDQVQRNLNYAMGAPAQRDIDEADAKVASAQAKLEDARLEYDRVKQGPDPREVELLQATLRNANAQLAAAQSSLADLALTAPFDGMIVSNNLEAGEIVGPASTIQLGDLSSWQVQTTDLKEASVVSIQAGKPVSVRFDAIPGLELPGVVNRIKSIGEDAHGDIIYTIYVNLSQQDPRLLWNMTARVNFNPVAK
jgi:multidrug resistance efflux pump